MEYITDLNVKILEDNTEQIQVSFDLVMSF